METGNLQGYAATQDAAAFYVISGSSYLRIAGPDRRDFLQRQSTNDLHLLEPAKALFTVLTSPMARVLDVLCLLQEAEAIAAIARPTTKRYLKNQIFFMDKVTVSDDGEQFSLINVLGPQSQAALSRLGIDHPPEWGGAMEASISASPLRLIRLEKPFGIGYWLIVPTQNLEHVRLALAAIQVAPLAPQAYRVIQVESGIPAAGYELTEDYTPLEAGLEAAISSQKGCYTGQEVIARQLTYDKVTQRLCRLSLEGPVNSGERIWIEGKNIGRITSAVISPRCGSIALAMVKRSHFQAGTTVRVGNTSVEGVNGNLGDLV